MIAYVSLGHDHTMSHMPLERATPLLAEHTWIDTAIAKAAADYVTRHKGQAVAYNASVRASVFREHVVSEIRKQRLFHRNTSVDDRPQNNIFSLILSEDDARLALTFKKLRGYKPSAIQTKRQKAIAAQALSLELDGTIVVPTWVYVGWKWDAPEQEIVSTRVACWENGALAWHIPDMSTMVGYESLELNFTAPTTTDEFDAISFEGIMRPKRERNIIQLRDGTQDQP
jgi:hypothetical protein